MSETEEVTPESVVHEYAERIFQGGELTRQEQAMCIGMLLGYQKKLDGTAPPAAEGWLNMSGTSLPNAKHIVLTDGKTRVCKWGVYLWPNGWVTAYIFDDTSRGSIYPPNKVDHISFS